MKLAFYATRLDQLPHYGLLSFCALVFLLQTAPVLVIIPLSFTSSTLLSYPVPDFSWRWYENFFTSDQWMSALKSTMIVGSSTTVLATGLGTLAALGLNRARFRFKAIITALLISPMMVPIVVTALAIFLFYAWIGLAATYFGLILAHTALAIPFVVITVTATLQGFDQTLARAAASLGAPPSRVFFKIILPLILPGILSGAVFAFVISFDEIVVALFLAGPEQRTLPREIFSGVRDRISPTIAAVAVLGTIFAIFLMITVEALRRRNERLRTSQSNSFA